MTNQYAKDQLAGFSNRIQRIAIVGAAGTVGKPITEELLRTGQHSVTALTRIGSTSQVPAGVQSITVDYDDEASLVRALQGQDCLIISLSVRTPRDTQSKLLQAASQAGIRHVMPNVWGCDVTHPPLADSGLNWGGFRDLVAGIEAEGMAWTALICGFWYEHSLVLGPSAFGFDLSAKKLILNDDGNTKVNVSTLAQCGRAVATLLSLPVLPEDEQDDQLTMSRWRNKPMYISDFLLTQRDMLASWLRVTGDTADSWTIEQEPSQSRYERGLESVKQGDHAGLVLAMYSRVFFPNGDGNYEQRQGLDNNLLRLPTEDLDEHTREAKLMFDRGYNYMTNRN
ncbi:oxidoreductase CipA-like protein [Aspergillus piperis CBS 112811]|uniref:Oxidoreductase CipA-like protein n=1 Tax=Aspergillus piperis CBS 112811 TaxID=1448313 RepID=A0A8G1R7X5_9EURO|nr:oxidoreductase CipA-like protein [Aspergillus piperis CBS 112811]RAH59385.1 oxidoreductase CipA-like protein [Aspergillus piperis CBS 112811]